MRPFHSLVTTPAAFSRSVFPEFLVLQRTNVNLKILFKNKYL